MTTPALPPFADRCPRCVTALAFPLVTMPGQGQVECLYECVCGYRWATTWVPDDEGSEAA